MRGETLLILGIEVKVNFGTLFKNVNLYFSIWLHIWGTKLHKNDIILTLSDITLELSDITMKLQAISLWNEYITLGVKVISVLIWVTCMSLRIWTVIAQNYSVLCPQGFTNKVPKLTLIPDSNFLSLSTTYVWGFKIVGLKLYSVECPYGFKGRAPK